MKKTHSERIFKCDLSPDLVMNTPVPPKLVRSDSFRSNAFHNFEYTNVELIEEERKEREDEENILCETLLLLLGNTQIEF